MRNRQTITTNFLNIIFIEKAVAEKKLVLIEDKDNKNILIYFIFIILLFKGNQLYNINTDCIN
jgi:hypothetical protein